MIIVQGGGPQDMSLFAFGQMTPATTQMLQAQNFNLGQTLTDAGRAFMERSQQIFERFNGDEAIRRAKAAIRTIQHAFQPDIIRPLRDIGALQQAPYAMQRWIMASPDVREWYHQQRCDGYSNAYVDMEPGSVGEQHRDYRMVMNGIAQEHPEADWVIYNYFEHEDDDVKLTLGEQVDILSAWDLVRSMLKLGKEDPTSPYCDKL